MRIVPGVAAALVLSVILVGCSQTESPETTGEPTSTPNASGLMVPDVDALLATPVHWDSGVLEVFDDVATMDPAIVPLRAAIAAREKQWGEELFAGLEESAETGEMEPTSLSVPRLSTQGQGPMFPPPLPRGGGGPGSAPAAAGGQSGSMGASFMLGAMAPEMLNLAFIGGSNWADLEVGATETDGKGSVFTKTDENNASVEVQSEHQEVVNDTIVKTNFKLKIEGTMCPAVDGDFDVTITVDQMVTATTRTGESWEQQNVMVNAAGTLGEDALPERYDVETVQTTNQKHADGRSGYTQSVKQRNDLNFREMDKDASTVTGTSGNLTQSEMDAITQQGDSRAVALATGQMLGLFKHWLLGGCVQIKHDAKATVEPNSTSDIKVETNHRVSKTEVPSNVTLTLTGEKSIDPQEFKSPNTFRYTAGEEDTKATIDVKATSRRGGDRQKITIEAVGDHAYQAIGGTDGYELSEADNAIVCEFTTWGLTSPGYSASDGYSWAFVESGGTTFQVIKGGGSYMRIREGSWQVELDADGKPAALVMTYANGFDIRENAEATDLGGGSGRFELKQVPKPEWCDSMVTE